jgi:hypothetical protein
MDKLRLFKIKSSLDNERKMLAMLDSRSFSILSFIKEAKNLSGSCSLKQPNLTPFILEDNTLDVKGFKLFARDALLIEIRESIKYIEDALQPIREAQALLDDKEIQQLLKE